MSIEKPEIFPSPPTYEIDISEGWDTPSQAEVFLKELKKLRFYRPGLLYSGFDGDQIGKSWGSTEGKFVVFCATVADISGEGDYANPLEFAMEYKNPAIAVYDSAKLEFVDPVHQGNEGYRIKDPTAIVGIIGLK